VRQRLPHSLKKMTLKGFCCLSYTVLYLYTGILYHCTFYTGIKVQIIPFWKALPIEDLVRSSSLERHVQACIQDDTHRRAFEGEENRKRYTTPVTSYSSIWCLLVQSSHGAQACELSFGRVSPTKSCNTSEFISPILPLFLVPTAPRSTSCMPTRVNETPSNSSCVISNCLFDCYHFVSCRSCCIVSFNHPRLRDCALANTTQVHW
jgi:hypothetical protein